MSGITQYVVAGRSAAKTVSDHPWPIERWTGCFGFKFFGPDDLAPLSGLVRGGTGSHEDFPELAFGEHAWVYGMPADLVSALAAAGDGLLRQLAAGWSERLAAGRSPRRFRPDE